MPSFSSSSIIRATSQEHGLRLKITHNLVYGSPSDRVYSAKAHLLKELDVLWLSDVTLSLSGSLDADRIPAYDIVCSGLVRHLHVLLKTNADRLGLNNVSPPFVDDIDGLPKCLTLTPSRPLPQPSRPHALLVSLHLAYIWRSVTESSGSSSRLIEEAGPFSPNLFLPVEALLNRVTEQFLTHHLVGRYPFIFGPWCKRLDSEMQYFPSIASSILEIMARSENRAFLLKCKRLLKIARSQHKYVLHASSTALSSCTYGEAIEPQKEEADDLSAGSTLTDEQILCESLEQLYRRGTPQRRFKPASTPKFIPFPQEGDDDGLLQFITDERNDNEASWVELPQSAMSPLAGWADCSEMWPEDVDTCTKEDWSADVMWGGHEADTSLVGAVLTPPELVWGPQSARSLIDVPLASTITRSPQACSFTLYHHRNVDYHALDPAASEMGDAGSQMEESGLALFANLTHSPLWTAHDPCFSDEDGQVTQGLRDVPKGVDSWTKQYEDTESLLLEDETGDGTEVNLDWF